MDERLSFGSSLAAPVLLQPYRLQEPLPSGLRVGPLLLAKAEVNAMTTRDDRNTAEVLKAELDFVEKGGYGRSVKTPWQPTSIFQDSLTCINLGDPERTHPCSECLLIDFVPPEARAEEVPCHHIPLSVRGETIDELELQENQGKAEETVKHWLYSTISQLEEHSAPESTA